jgi:Phosphoglycerate dehydrogenase and related dehydrogenases
LGIIGYGNIGSQLSVLAESLGMEVYFYDIVDKLPLGNAKKCQSLKELLKKVDVVTVHVDGRKENKNLIGEKEFQLMKDGVIFLNLSRGYVVDINALVKYIKNGKIKGAAVDVFPNEPKSNQEKFISPLQNLENVILTPHIGGSTIEAQANIADFVSQKIIDYINNGDTILSVNFPQIKLPTQKNFYRFIHIHQNLPGVLAQINQILSQNNINIEGQYLKTNEKIGYVITDVNRNYFKKIENDLKKVKGTIKFRVLY